MTQVIKIKRTLGQAVDSTGNAQGELFYIYDTTGSTPTVYSKKLFIGNESGGTNAPIAVGGQYFTDLLDHTAGTLTASSAVIVDANSKVDVFYVDNLKLDVNTISATNTNGDINFDTPGTGNVIFRGTSGGAGNGAGRFLLNCENNSHGIAIQGPAHSAGANYEITFPVNIEADKFLTTNGNGQLRWESVSTTLTVDSDGALTQNVDLLNDDLKIIGTANEIETAVTKSGTDVSLTIGLPNDVTIAGNLTLTGNTIKSSGGTTAITLSGDDVTIAGDLTVSGTTTTINTETINLADNIILINSNFTGSSPTAQGGIEVERGTQTNAQLIWEEATDKWQAGISGSLSNLLTTGNFQTEITTIDGGTYT